jgi:hypothetical protein
MKQDAADAGKALFPGKFPQVREGVLQKSDRSSTGVSR